MRKIAYILIIATASLLGACADDAAVPTVTASVEIQAPADVAGLTVKSERLTFRNLSTGESVEFSSTTGINLPVGFYECSYEADVTYVNGSGDDAATISGQLIGNAESVRATADGVSLSLPVYLVADNDDFIFEEIFFTGTRRTSGSSYIGDTYFKIYNNTDHVLYADGLAFVESKFRSTQSYNFTPDLKQEAMTVHAIYVIPGSGTDHPVQPGQSLTICDSAIDHRVSNENSFDLTGADFEWYDVSTTPSVTDIDNPDVPNLDKWYCDTKSIYILHNQGFTSFALARIPVDKESYLTDYFYTYRYTLYLPTGTYPMSGDGYKIPNSWIVDGVNLSAEAERKWNILPASIDAGWTWCARMSSDNDRFFKSVRRKMLYLTDDGRRVLKDSNNSTNDFNAAVVPSIVEQQHTAVNASGDKATTVTYDGVQPIKESEK